MSKIGKKPIIVPSGVEVTINGSSLSIKGPKGELKKDFFPSVSLKLEDGKLNVKSDDSKIWGLCRALAANMIKGVSEGFTKVLEFTGVGYKAQVKSQTLELNLGFTNPVIIQIPTGISVTVEKSSLTIQGIDRGVVGQLAAEIRASRPPEPYKGSGIKYKDEIIRRKAGKKAATASAA